MALGSADITLFELTNAYRAIADGGCWNPVQFEPIVHKPTSCARQALSPQAAFIVKSILSDRQARSATFGLENSLSTPYWTAVKTGTSKDMRDNWTVGFSDRYTVGVWAGNFSGGSMWHVSGVEGAAPVWLEIMNYLHARTPSRSPLAPDGLVQKTIRFVDTKQIQSEWFIAGTEPASADIAVEDHVDPRILYPVQGTIIAIDPRIPKDRAAMYFQFAGLSKGFVAKVDGKKLGKAKEFMLWDLVAGHHKLALLNAKGRVVDEIAFGVRGARAQHVAALSHGDGARRSGARR